mgnify:FL=1
MAKRARPHVIMLRVNDAELALIEERMQQAGIMNREAYLRRAAINCYLLSMKLPEVKEISRLLGYAGNNLNQLAHQANASGWVSQREVASLRGRFEEIISAQRALLEKLARL